MEEGNSTDSGNLGSSRMELEEELKRSARRSSGLWGRGILGLGREENIAAEGLLGFLLRRSIVQVVTLTFSLYPLFMF